MQCNRGGHVVHMKQITKASQAVIVDEYRRAVQQKEMLSIRITVARMAGEIHEATCRKEEVISWVRSLERILRELGFSEDDLFKLHAAAQHSLYPNGSL